MASFKSKFGWDFTVNDQLNYDNFNKLYIT